MGWHTIELVDSVQIVPDYESEHVLSRRCWCQPKVEDGPSYRIPIISHRDILEREYSDG